MRIVFFGATKLGARCCRTLVEKGLGDVVGIFTAPRRFAISYAPAPVTNVLHEDFEALGARLAVPVVTVTEKMGAYAGRLREMSPDFILVAGWYHMIPRALRELAPRGCAGLHASLLPRYRGGAPLVWAMINGETETGVTFFHFADGVDDGDIIGQERFAVGETETIADLLVKAEDASVALVARHVPEIAAGRAPRIPQDESRATRFPQRSPEDGAIDWSWDAARIRNFIRAQTRPYPGAFTVVGGKKVTLWDADVVDAKGD